jgi:amidase
MDEQDHARGISRRGFLRRGALAAAGSAMLGSAAPGEAKAPHGDLEEVTISDLQKAMEEGRFGAEELVHRYLERIEALSDAGPRLRAVIEPNPEAPAIARALDMERKFKGARGPLHGIPILLKDNIDTADRMQTAAGSLALLGTRPAQDATVARRLREAGAVLLGKANLSEWANIRSNRSISGWSGRGGQCRNPYVITCNPCGSSSGSAVAVSANLCVGALGTETDGSIVCPSHINGVVGIKPTLGLTSRAGVVPLSHSQDTVGTHARTVRDAAILLGAIAGVDPRDPATAAGEGRFLSDYTRFLDPEGLKGARIGVVRKGLTGYSDHADRVLGAAIAAMGRAGATIIDPADIATIDEMNAGDSEMTVLLYDFKDDLNAYLAKRVPDPARGDVPPVRTLEEVIAFNSAHAAEEMPYFGQELFLESQKKGPLTDAAYLEALEKNRRISRQEGIDKVMETLGLDALVAPTGNPAWPIDFVNGDHFLGASSTPAALAGYPLVTVPAGDALGLPVGITFMGRAFGEPVLLRLAYAFELISRARRTPAFLEALERG